MTDLRHVGELLHAAAMAEQMGATALTAWLRARVLEAARGQQRRGAQPPARVRRRGGPGAHRAPQQGARVPGRLLPRPLGAVVDPAQRTTRRSPSTTPTATRTIDVGLDGPAVERPRAAEHRRAARRGPAARLRRADAREAPGRRVVGGVLRQPRLGAGAAAVRARRRGERARTSGAACRPTPPPPTASRSCAGARLRQRRAAPCSGRPCRWPGDVGRVVGAVGVLVRPRARPVVAAHLLQRHHRGTYEARVASEPEEAVVDDESARARAAGRGRRRGGAARRAVAARRACRSGVEVGTLVHRVFESTDFAAADLDAELVEQVAAAQARRRVELGDLAGVVAGLRAAIETPLGPAGGRHARCATSRARDRLDELDFELPLVGGDDPSGPALTLAAIADVLRAHSAPDDPLAGYAERLLDPRCARACAATSRAASTSSCASPASRFAVVDYKTNWLALPGEDLTAWHHRPAALERRDDALALRAAGAALHRRAASLPALAAARLLRRAQPRRRALPVHARDDRAGHAGRRRRARAASSPGSRRRRSSRR